MTRRKLLKVSHVTTATGVVLAVAGLVSFEWSDVRHTELRSVLLAFAGLAVTVVGALSVAMCKIATAAIAPRLAAALLEEHMAVEPRPKLRLLTPDRLAHRRHG